MGKVILCSGTKAKHPYRFQELNIKVWSIEELAYVLIQNSIVWDDTSVTKELVEWIKVECGLVELSKRLLNQLISVKPMNEFILEIVDYLGYYSEDEIETLKKELITGQKMPLFMKQKKRADYLVEQKKYGTAIIEYSKILKKLEIQEIMVQSDILHNQGVAYCRMFQFYDGAKCFFKAYQLHPSVQSYEQYLFALRMYMSETEYINYINDQQLEIQSSLDVEQRLKQAVVLFEESVEKENINCLLQQHKQMQFTQYFENVENTIENLKNNYREAYVEV